MLGALVVPGMSGMCLGLCMPFVLVVPGMVLVPGMPVVVVAVLWVLVGPVICIIMFGAPGTTTEWWTCRHQTYASTRGATLSSPRRTAPARTSARAGARAGCDRSPDGPDPPGPDLGASDHRSAASTPRPLPTDRQRLDDLPLPS